ncbi:ROK family transcriptional regulator [Roseomonas sp. GC11]|uniref:ROK family transcriptional regulator n=1 Tax=Roseomonas sp. GC11 TaxID=2950546 RepID=UPI00210CFEA2|nr:ROK family transcriptional regulator [Roseomonas sp. GC11]MCQ4162169.1 ROK family transcriptional regulator [Roseomonas sp. GC11]
MLHPPRTRRQTRAAILGRLLAEEGLFRPMLARECQVTEGSLSRILAELRAEGLVEELRRPVPYPGGPSTLVALGKNPRVAALEFVHDRLGFGLGPLGGGTDMAGRLPLPPAATPAALEAIAAEAVDSLAAWCARAGLRPWQVAVSIPGHVAAPPAALAAALAAAPAAAMAASPGAGRPNPILPLDPARLEARLRRAFPGVPLVLANTATALAAMHLHGPGAPPLRGRHLFLAFGHGVGGAWVDPVTDRDPIRPIEIGHVVLDPQGPACRCGHRGCLEAVASTVALAGLCGVAEAELVAAGAEWPRLARLTPRREAALRGVLGAIGLVLGNALNLQPVARVVLCGWPAALPPPLRAAVAEGMARSLFGGGGPGGPDLLFLPAAPPAPPAAALALAAHALIRRGGLAALEEPALS